MTPLPGDRTANLVLWAVIWSGLWGWQLVTAVSDRLPSFADMARLARRWPVSRWLLLAWWAWLGWHLFVRTTY